MIIKDFKKAMYESMIENFKRDGFLQPVIFFIKDNQPVIVSLPTEIFATSESKNTLANTIKLVCDQPMVTAAGIIFEGIAKKLKNDNEMVKLILEGSIKISEIKDHEDIIIMIFSTPEGDEMFAHIVDCENKTIKEEIEDSERIGGLFSGFFNWIQN